VDPDAEGSSALAAPATKNSIPKRIMVFTEVEFIVFIVQSLFFL